MSLASPETAQVLRLVSIPLISAFIGWFTNALAVRMIFRPRRPCWVLGVNLQGLVPKRRDELARSIGQTVEEHLISHGDILAILEKAEFQEGLDAAIRERIRDFLDTKLAQISPMLPMMFSGQLREKVEGLLVKEVSRIVPELSAQMMDRLEEHLNFREIVEAKVRSFDLDKLEQIIQSIAARELKAIELLGGVLGFVIGLIQVVLLLV
jgi:uncharacterized membrane protein YheB (UPF0754 family)